MENQSGEIVLEEKEQTNKPKTRDIGLELLRIIKIIRW